MKFWDNLFNKKVVGPCMLLSLPWNASWDHLDFFMKEKSTISTTNSIDLN